jgi:hypothetical protein
MNPGYSALTPIPSGFLRWNATLELHFVPDSKQAKFRLVPGVEPQMAI